MTDTEIPQEFLKKFLENKKADKYGIINHIYQLFVIAL